MTASTAPAAQLGPIRRILPGCMPQYRPSVTRVGGTSRQWQVGRGRRGTAPLALLGVVVPERRQACREQGGPDDTEGAAGDDGGAEAGEGFEEACLDVA